MAATTEETVSNTKFESRLQLAVEGLNPYFRRLLLEISRQNSTYIIDFVINELKRESNASVRNQISGSSPKRIYYLIWIR
jgi:hypothetical protein